MLLKLELLVVVVLVIVAPLPKSSCLLIPQRNQSRFSLLNYLCCFQRLFLQISVRSMVLCWYLATVKDAISIMCVC